MQIHLRMVCALFESSMYTIFILVVHPFNSSILYCAHFHYQSTMDSCWSGGASSFLSHNVKCTEESHLLYSAAPKFPESLGNRAIMYTVSLGTKETQVSQHHLNLYVTLDSACR